MHDTLEDTDYTEEKLKEDFGEEVLFLVKFASEPNNNINKTHEEKINSWRDRKQHTITALQNSEGYGYQWWTNPELNTFYAAGRNGQYIIVVPDQDIVAVFTSGIYEGNTEIPLHTFQDFVLHYALRNTIVTSIVVSLLVVPLVILGYYRTKSKRAM